MIRNERQRAEFIAAVETLQLEGPYFVEERLTRHRGPFLRAVKDVPVGGTWWEIRYFPDCERYAWAYLPEQPNPREFAWGHTLEQAFLNALWQQPQAPSLTSTDSQDNHSDLQ
ncbi:hypothetical protein [Thermostichus vulcanus]|uniref:Uncharacterized protein n=1 Tax=Thermostichus vulcanus str. 'Rupite' TaxID=2813851 RepID=A0ABT0C870_THEVL|nr:hypothetical protein [Thermostichus vulcanus]MCJ2541987.1 hypothetical protein [Thermostichus vulcanus str. 'Rupite']